MIMINYVHVFFIFAEQNRMKRGRKKCYRWNPDMDSNNMLNNITDSFTALAFYVLMYFRENLLYQIM